MTEQPKADLRTMPGGIHLQPSKLLVVALIVAAAATGALIVTLLVEMPSSGPPPRPDSGVPPPPPNLQSLVVFQVVTAFFVLAWLAVLVVFCRDQILRQLRLQQPEPPPPGLGREELSAVLADLRGELARDRANELRAFGDLIEEYGERRETEGYLNGMRTATMSDRPEPNVRSFRRTPPPR